MLVAGTAHLGEAAYLVQCACCLPAEGLGRFGAAGAGGPCLCHLSSIHGGEASTSTSSFLNLPLL